MKKEEEIKKFVRERYGEAARSAGGCCCSSSCCGSSANPITKDLYDAAEVAGLPQEAVLASLGCANPLAVADLKPGEVVLDLGSGGGIDVLLSAKRVGPTGKVYGLDMTDEMLALARRNAQAARVTNVEFLKGEIEAIPLPDASVEVIHSNCVVNLSPNKDAVFAEAFRVLKPGGRFAIADIVVRGELPEAIRKHLELWAGCVAGALKEEEYRAKLANAGFTEIEIAPARIYTREDAEGFLPPEALAEMDAEGSGTLLSAFIRARKPAA